MPPRPAYPRRPPNSPFNAARDASARIEVFEIDDRVTHDRLGLGVVMSIGPGNTVVVRFGDDVCRVTLPNSKLSKL